MNKETIIKAIRAFVAQRSGIDFKDYGGDRDAFMGDYRPMLKAGQDARVLLAAVSGRDGITADNIVEATHNSRLQLVERTLKGTDIAPSYAVDYTTGQYFPTEYRAAACRVLATALWKYAVTQGYSTGNEIRKWARSEFGRGIANRWFN